MKTIKISLAALVSVASCVAWAGDRYDQLGEQETIFQVASRARPQGSAFELNDWVLAIYNQNPQVFPRGFFQVAPGAAVQLPDEDEVAEAAAQGRERLMASGLGYLVPSAPPVGRSTVLAPQLPASLRSPAPAVQLGAMPSSVKAAQAKPIASRSTRDRLLLLEGSSSEPQESFVDHQLFTDSVAAIKEGRQTEVVGPLASIEDQYAGDPDFDYIFGVVLLDVGRPREAIYALQRASHARPSDFGIQLDLGRAYFQNRENESARRVFASLEMANPPAEAAAVIASYVQAADVRAQAYEKRWGAQIHLTGGFDDNANAASELNEFLGFQLSDAARAQQSAYAALRFGGDFSVPLTIRWRWNSKATIQARNYSDADELQTLLFGLQSGFGFQRGAWRAHAVMSAAQSMLDGEDNNLLVGVDVGGRYQITAFTFATAGLRHGISRYAKGLELRDVSQTLLAFELGRRFALGKTAEVSLTGVLGRDTPRLEASPFGRDIQGLELHAFVQPTVSWRFELGAELIESQYEGDFFGVSRTDRRQAASVSVLYANLALPAWQFGLSALASRNESDVEIYAFDRVDYQFTVSKFFN